MLNLNIVVTKKIMIFFFVFITFAINAQSVQIEKFATVKEKAKKENKNILLYFSGSDWCANCIKFRTNYINTPLFQQFSSEKLIIINADFPRSKKNALSKEQVKENEALAETYNTSGLFPFIALLNPEGKILKQWDGSPSETLEEFIKALQ